ncbi:uncharacterized protein GGS25DRAFT_467373 [Hypoxylon fragiforme]|uniref:uncharacterized protein n=1 Tax=Hypoxylon fragiforme TaxID=63214 RepID=UPI0020C647AC|nr:uncharacterized protein GGS25DRAFT_467373 [Hypoxylon fragiforme]KAI2613491.1 hypothetical protein GGS25DRAFT_467373 [Hypoxylon fragiforme]
MSSGPAGTQGAANSVPHSQDQSSQGGAVNEVNNEKNVQQVSDDHLPPEDGDHPRIDSANEKREEPKQDEPTPRRSTLKNKVKERKDKLKTKAKPPGGFDPTPFPDAPPGYTVKFTFHRAENLPAADFSTGSSDPFLTATLTTSLPKRHREDPDLVYRTRTFRRTLEAKWEQDWIVANVPSSGFKLKCRLYDEDWPDHDDRLGNATIIAGGLSEDWEGFREKEFEVKKRSGSKRAYILKACTSAFTKDVSMTPRLYMSAVVLGQSDPPYGHMYTVGPTYYFKHFSPMIGLMTGIKVNIDESNDAASASDSQGNGNGDGDGKQVEKRVQKYDFQTNEIQLVGPVGERLYHRFVEFRPIIGLLFRGRGLRGKILNKALHHQHRRLYNFDKSTQFGTFEPCSEEASLQFLKMAHFDEGSRTFTYTISLDGMMRFCETDGGSFGIDLLSKHTMHSDASVYIACSGEFFIRRSKKHKAPEDPESIEPVQSDGHAQNDHPKESRTARPEYYQLIIDNDSGTYRPDKSVLPDLQKLLERNFPGLNILTLACDDPEDQKLKEEQAKAKKKAGGTVNMVLNRSPSASSFSSDDLSDLEDMERAGGAGRKSKRERAWDLLEEPRRIKELAGKQSAAANSSGPSGPSGSGTKA